MGLKQIPTKLFIQFLLELELKHLRTSGDHFIYNNPSKPLSRPVIVRTNKKEIPITHIHTNLKTVQISKQEFEVWLKKNS